MSQDPTVGAAKTPRPKVTAPAIVEMKRKGEVVAVVLAIPRPEDQVFHERFGIVGVIPEDAPRASAQQARGEIEGGEDDVPLAGGNFLGEVAAGAQAFSRELAQPGATRQHEHRC